MSLSNQMQKKVEELERQKAQAQRPRFSSEEREAKYFKTLLGKNETTAKKRIRILPPKGTEEVFQEGWFHNIKIPNYNKTKIYDPGRNDGQHSPLNEVAKNLRSIGTDEAKKLAREYDSSKYYIIRIIDRDNEADGVKFWRFPHNSKGEGIFNKIYAVVEARGDIDDPKTGRDLILTLSKQNNGVMEWTSVTGILDMDPSPLHADSEVANAWINDELTWKDVYQPKPIEYLQILADGGSPKWDKDLGKFVSAEEHKSSDSVTFGNQDKKFFEEKKEVRPQPDPQVDDEPDEDLPF